MKLRNLLMKISMIFALALVLVGAVSTAKALAAGSVSVKEINYEKSTITVQMAAGDSILFISDDKQKKWECIPLEKDAGNCITFDMSWVSTSKNYTMSFKGDVSDTPVKIVLPKQVTNFKATYSAMNGGSITFSNDTGRTIQWKKRESLRWSSFPTSAAGFQDTLYSLCSNGAVLMFRLAPENGNGTNPGQRASKEVVVSVKKKTAAPTVKVDDGKMALYAVKGMEYRYCDEDGNPTNPAWTAVTKTEYVPLSTIAGKSIYDNSTNTNPIDTYIQFRTAATSSQQVSNIATVKIPAQEDMPSDITDKAKLEYTSKSSFKISVSIASSSNPYEYCIINQDDVKDGIKITDFNKISWKPISSSSAITINQTEDKVKDGSLVYLRRKAYKSLGDEEYKLASPWILLGTVTYPGDISTGDGSLTWLTTTVGVCNENNNEGNLTFTMYSPTSSPITTIRFMKYDSPSIQIGTPLKIKEDFRCNVVKNDSAGSDKDKAYIITATIFNLSNVDSAVKGNEDGKLIAKMKLEGSTTEFESTADKGGVAIYIHPKTVINNPGDTTAKNKVGSILAGAGNSSWSGYNSEKDAAAFTTSFSRVYMSDRICPANTPLSSKYDAHQFRVRLDIGTRYMPDKTKSGGFTSEKISVTKIKYDGVDLLAGDKYFTVDYADITDDNKQSWEKRMAVITFNVNEIEKNTAITVRDQEKPVSIYLSNGEVISDVKLKLTSTVSPEKEIVTISFAEGEVPEKEVTTTIVDGVTTTTEKPLPDKYSMSFSTFKSGYSVTCLSATWNGYDILAGVDSSSGVVKVTFSNKKLNAIDVANTTSGYVKFVFDNGFECNSDCKITITAQK